MSTVSISEILADALGRPPFGAVRIVVVDGPSGSGKSTLAARLAAEAKASLLEGDSFLSWSPDFIGFWPRFEQQVLVPLSQQRDARYQARDWRHDEFGTSLGEWRTLPWSPVVIVDGVSFARRAGAERIAFRVWVEAPDDVRLTRGLARDGESHRELWLDWMRRESDFFQEDGTRDRADILVNGAPNDAHRSEGKVVVLAR